MSQVSHRTPRWLFPVCLAVLLALTSLTFAPRGLAAGTILKLPRTVAANHAGLTPLDRLQEFTRLLSEKGVAQPEQTKFSADFQKLPADLQTTILSHTSTRLPLVASPISSKYLSAAAKAGAIALLATPSVTSCFPDPGEAGVWCGATGSALGTNCQAILDGSPLTSFYINYAPVYPNTLYFFVPAATAKGGTHTLTVTNLANSKTSSPVSYRVVAERSYRGYYGWQFPNFGDSTIPWTAYADYFGVSNVQNPDGSHRSAAQTYYDHTYKGCGGGGNCFGMSVSSLRFKMGLPMGYWNTWFHTSPTNFTYAWWYPETASGTTQYTQNHQTVQEYQGSWLSQEVLDTHAVTRNQGAQGCFNRAASFVGSASKCVIVMWGHGAGHVVVPYRTNISGDDHQLICYDNNYPYSETESNGPDPTIAHVAWGANTFSDPTESWATWAECMSYAEVTPATPHLPGASYGGPGSTTAVVSVDPGTQLTQITDEAGHTFFNPDGSENTNPGTRIPNSAIVYPLIGVVVEDRVVRNLPILFVFSQASGKSLMLQVAGSVATRSLQLYTPGFIFDLQATGAGQVRAFDLLRDTRGFEILNPAALRPTSLRLLHSAAVGDRTFQLSNFTGLGAQALFLRPVVDGSRLNLQAPTGLRFDLSLRGPFGQGEGQTRFTAVQTLSAISSLALDDWERPTTSALSFQALSAAGAIQQTLHLNRAGQ